MAQQKFTSYLLDKYASDFKKAINNPFLVQAGEWTIHRDILREWLKQDYLYAYVGYIKFASALLSRLHLPTSPSSASANTSRALSTLAFSLSNVKRETDFFVSTAAEHDLELFGPPAESKSDGNQLLGEYNPVTRSYVDFLHAIGGLGSIEEGLVLLWAMEKAYLEAWLYAKSHRSTASTDNPNETQKALEKFIDNWTCDEFVEFVQDCEEVVDALNIELGSDAALRAEEVFKRTLWLEQRFWPTVKV